ncbi:MAG: hypothetical protein HQ568_02525 [Calditrichaeota bacterium]|nr:hypothetical protein [Calditrichota bacterium]
MPSLRKRTLQSGKSTWNIRYYQNGNRKTHTIGKSTKEEAERMFHRFCVDFSDGRIGNPRLSNLAAWTRVISEGCKASTTVEREQAALRMFINTMGDITIAELNHSKIEEYKQTRLTSCTKSTVNTEIQILNMALRQANSHGYIASRIGPFSLIAGIEKKPPTWLTAEQIQALLTTETQNSSDSCNCSYIPA